MTDVALNVNGKPVSASVEPRTHLADFLREELLLTGTHLGCEHGICGACTVEIDSEIGRACITFAAACDGARVRTIEDFDDDPLMARLRDAFRRHHGLQCGYCTPGMLMTACDLIRRKGGLTEQDVRVEMSGNLCRCTGYQGIIAAVMEVMNDRGNIVFEQAGRSGPGPWLNGAQASAITLAPRAAASPVTAIAEPAKASFNTEAATNFTEIEHALTVNSPRATVWGKHG